MGGSASFGPFPLPWNNVMWNWLGPHYISQKLVYLLNVFHYYFFLPGKIWKGEPHPPLTPDCVRVFFQRGGWIFFRALNTLKFNTFWCDLIWLFLDYFHYYFFPSRENFKKGTISPSYSWPCNRFDIKMPKIPL